MKKKLCGTHPALLLLFACKIKSVKLVIGIFIFCASSKGSSSDNFRLNFSLFHVFLGKYSLIIYSGLSRFLKFFTSVPKFLLLSK